MATKIEWTDQVWNPIVGCTKVSAGCDNCYAMRLAHNMDRESNKRSRFVVPQYAGTTKLSNGKPNWTGLVNLAEHKLTEPLGWRKPRRIFVNSMSDLFHESVHDDWIDKIFAVMALCPQHTFQILTKRPERMAKYIDVLHGRANTFAGYTRRAGAYGVYCYVESIDSNFRGGAFAGILNRASMRHDGSLDDVWPLPNVWLGVSVEDQATTDARVPILLDTPAAVRFVSVEPMLGPVDFSPDAARYCWYNDLSDGGVPLWLGPNWVICGGESGPGARPMHTEWVRAIRNQCMEASVPFFFKQVGGINKKAAGRELDGRTWDQYPNGHISASDIAKEFEAAL